MSIYLASCYFLTREEEGFLFGCFYKDDLQISQPIYSQEIAYKALERISEDLELLEEEKKAVETCIEGSGLPLNSSAEEINELRLGYLESELETLYDLFSQILENNQIEAEVEANCLTKKQDTPLN